LIVQKLKTYDKTKAKWPAIVAPKLDGVRGKYSMGNLISTQGNKIQGMSHITDQLVNIGMKLDGELTVPGKGFDSASGLIRNFQDQPNVVYNVFDIPDPALGTKEERLQILTQLFDSGALGSDTVKLIEHRFVDSHNEMMVHYEEFLSQGLEGLVYYQPGCHYEYKKNYKWMRVIPFKTADCKVVRFTQGGGKNIGSLGAIWVDFNGVECKVGTGFKELFEDNIKEHVRQYIWDNREMFRGAIAECEYKEKSKFGKMRQARFKGWRWEKTEGSFE
jgi:ATP-dependent DNA ligase